jgi:hypothetical protein
LTQITPARTSNAVPESLRRLHVVADASIAGNPWYLFAGPQAAPMPILRCSLGRLGL